jgi:hypothetical protein
MGSLRRIASLIECSVDCGARRWEAGFSADRGSSRTVGFEVSGMGRCGDYQGHLYVHGRFQYITTASNILQASLHEIQSIRGRSSGFQ